MRQLILFLLGIIAICNSCLNQKDLTGLNNFQRSSDSLKTINNFKQSSNSLKATNNFKQFCDSLITYNLPFSTDKITISFISVDDNHSNYHNVYDLPCGKILGENFVGIIYNLRPIDNILFYLVTYDKFGNKIDTVHFGGNIPSLTAEQFDNSIIDKDFIINMDNYIDKNSPTDRYSS